MHQGTKAFEFQAQQVGPPKSGSVDILHFLRLRLQRLTSVICLTAISICWFSLFLLGKRSY